MAKLTINHKTRASYIKSLVLNFYLSFVCCKSVHLSFFIVIFQASGILRMQMTIFKTRKNRSLLYGTNRQIFEHTLNYGDVNIRIIAFKESVEHFN